MTRLNKLLLVLCAVAVAASIATWSDISRRAPMPAPETPAPWGVVYFVCRQPQSMLLTTDPPIVIHAGETASPEAKAIINAIPDERVLLIVYAGPECEADDPRAEYN